MMKNQEGIILSLVASWKFYPCSWPYLKTM